MPTTSEDEMAETDLGEESDDDLDPRVRAYFRRQALESERVASPEYQSSLGKSALASSNASIGRAQIGGMAEGLAKLGTLRGVSPDVKPFTTTLAGLDAAQGQRETRRLEGEKTDERRAGVDSRVYEYLQDRRDRTREAAARRDSTAAEAGFKRDAAVAAANKAASDKRELATIAAGAKPAATGATTKTLAGVVARAPKEPTNQQFKDAGFARRLEAVEQDFEELSAGGYDRSSAGEAVAGKLPEALKGEATKRQAQAERNFINAVLRVESGAAIQQSEFESAEVQYFPRVGDTPEVVEQKRRNREQKRIDMVASAGAAYEKVPLATKRVVSPTPAAGTATAATGGKKVVRRQFNAALNKTRTTYDDGTTKEEDGNAGQ